MRRTIHDNDFMNFVMNPPMQEQAKYDMYVPQVSTMRILSDARTGGLGDVPLTSGGSDNSNSWVMPVVVIVVSAMALMTLYAVLKR